MLGALQMLTMQTTELVPTHRRCLTVVAVSYGVIALLSVAIMLAAGCQKRAHHVTIMQNDNTGARLKSSQPPYRGMWAYCVLPKQATEDEGGLLTPYAAFVTGDEWEIIRSAEMYRSFDVIREWAISHAAEIGTAQAEKLPFRRIYIIDLSKKPRQVSIFPYELPSMPGALDHDDVDILPPKPWYFGKMANFMEFDVMRCEPIAGLRYGYVWLNTSRNQILFGNGQRGGVFARSYAEALSRAPVVRRAAHVIIRPEDK